MTDKAKPIVYPKVEYPEAAIAFAIEPKSRNDEDKISAALHRILEEDPRFILIVIRRRKNSFFPVPASFTLRRSGCLNSATGIMSRSLFIRKKFLTRNHYANRSRSKGGIRNSRADAGNSVIGKPSLSRWNEEKALNGSTRYLAAPYRKISVRPLKKASSKPTQASAVAGYPLIDFKSDPSQTSGCPHRRHLVRTLVSGPLAARLIVTACGESSPGFAPNRVTWMSRCSLHRKFPATSSTT